MQISSNGEREKFNKEWRRSRDSIIKVEKNSAYPYMQGMLFLGQSMLPNARSHIFKMSTIGPGFGLELVNRMQQDGIGDLRHSWVCFDHVRRVVGWTTMVTHVYDPT